ncbi:tetratricopeptide repeat protein [Thermodesulfobacteriota bacterium]
MKKTIASALLYIALLIFTGCAGLVGTAPYTNIPLSGSYRSQAAHFERNDNLNRALICLNIAATLDPHNPEIVRRRSRLQKKIAAAANTHFNRGVTLYRKKSFDSARLAFLKVLHYKPDHPEALDYVFSRLGRPLLTTYTVLPGDTAAGIARKIYNSTNKSFLISYFNNLEPGVSPRPGSILQLPLLSWKPDAAIDVTKDISRARQHLQNGRYLKALRIIDIALESAPDNEGAAELANDARYRLAMRRWSQRDYLKAMDLFREIDPDFKDTQQRMSDLKNEMTREAEACYRRGIDYYVNEKLSEAIHEWELTLHLNPQHKKAPADIERAQGLLDKLSEVK